MSTVQAGRLVVTLEGKDQNLSEVISKVQARMQEGVSTARSYNTAIAEQDATTARAERQKLQYAAALAKVAAASGDSAGSIKILAGALDQVTPNTVHAQQALANLQNQINKLEGVKPPKIDIASGIEEEVTKTNQALNSGFNFNGLATQAIKAAGFVYSLKQAFDLFNNSIKAGVELDRIETVFKALSGSTEAYEKNLALAKEQQSKFGGSLTDTLDDMSSFVTLSKNTNIQLDQLTNLARAMSIIDPAQGFKGASTALKELEISSPLQ